MNDYELIGQIINQGSKNERSFMASGLYKKGTELTSHMVQHSIYPTIINELFEVMKFISNLSTRGLTVKGIDYSIKRMPEVETTPHIGSISFTNHILEEINNSIIVISTLEKDSLSINRATTKEINNLYQTNKHIGDHNLSDFIRGNIHETITGNFIRIDESYKKIIDDNNWVLDDKGYVKLTLDKDLFCNEECTKSTRHNYLLSKLGLQKPWEFSGELNCPQCNSKMTTTAAYPSFNEKQVFNQGHKQEEAILCYAIMHASQLGEIISRITALTLSKELGIKNNIPSLLILTKEITYKQGGNYYKIIFEDLDEGRFKRTLSRKNQINRLKFKRLRKDL